MSNPSEKSQVRMILQSPQWKTIEALANKFCDEVSYSNKVRDSEWDTLKAVLIDEGQVRGIRKFLQELYKEAQ